MTGGRAEILVLGLGNDILGDDAVGLCAAREFAAAARPGVDVLESSEAGFALLDILAGYGTVVIVDAIHTGTVPAGTLLEYSRADFHRLAGHSPHYVGLPELFSIAERLDLPFPADVRIVAMEIDDPWTLGEGLSPAIARELPSLVRRVAELTDLSVETKEKALRTTRLSC